MFEKVGSEDKPPMVFVPGFGFHGSIFEPWLQTLTSSYCCYLLDLEALYLLAEFQYDGDIFTCMAAELPQRAIWLAWSLGGLLTITMQNRFPGFISKQVFMATNPLFCGDQHWPGMGRERFEQFQRLIFANRGQAAKEFALLQQPEKVSRRLFGHCRAHSKLLQWKSTSLAFYLEFLKKTDHRLVVPNIEISTLWLFFEEDRLVPKAVSEHLKVEKNQKVTVMSNEGHYPIASKQLEKIMLHLRSSDKGISF